MAPRPPTIPAEARRAALAALAVAVSHAVHAERNRLTPRITRAQLELKHARRDNAHLWAIIAALVGIAPAAARGAARRDTAGDRGDGDR